MSSPATMDLAAILREALTRHGVPGATVGVLRDGVASVASAGTAKLPAGVPITDDTLFLIASISKVWTATLVLQLVDEGLVSLDGPVNQYLDPPLRLADQGVADCVTVRQLLSHTGGFFGDADEPEGENDDALRGAVDAYADLAQLYPPGHLFSYSNSGYNVLGRLIECLTGQTWDDALETRLIRPLGLQSTCSKMLHAATHPLAVGHLPRSALDHTLEPVQVWRVGRGYGPCGGTLATTAGDLLTFAELHLRGGVTAEGTRVLSTQSAALMQEPLVAQHYPADSAAWGLGWAISKLGTPRVIEHTGNISGQDSVLVLVPDLDLAVCVLTNGDLSGNLRNDLVGQILAEAAGIVRNPVLVAGPPDEAPDPAPVLGTYERMPGVFVRVEEGPSGLVLTVDPSDETGKLVDGFSTPLVHVTGWTYLYLMPLLGRNVSATFLFNGSEFASHLASGLRVSPRVDAR